MLVTASWKATSGTITTTWKMIPEARTMRPRDQITIVPPQRRLLRGQQANAGTQRAHNKGQNKIVKITQKVAPSISLLLTVPAQPLYFTVISRFWATIGHTMARSRPGLPAKKAEVPQRTSLKVWLKCGRDILLFSFLPERILTEWVKNLHLIAFDFFLYGNR